MNIVLITSTQETTAASVERAAATLPAFLPEPEEPQQSLEWLASPEEEALAPLVALVPAKMSKSD